MKYGIPTIKEAKRYWPVVITTIAASVTTVLLFYYLWNQLTIIAMALTGLYFFGSFMYLPWRTPLRKAFSVGIFIGIVLSFLKFFWLKA